VGVRVGDELLPDARVRKKGFLGSLSLYRPSLRIDVGKGETSKFHGQKHITLNNNRQDPSNAHQCVAYALFEKAGLAAPRCGLAHLTVNGADKGFYSFVEPIEEAFLQRVFGDDSGNLYEVTVPADFTPELVGRFELKTNETDADRSDLDRVVSALDAPEAELLDRLGEVFDLDEFITFWAMEALIAHVDGLSRNNNNTFLYHDPRDDRFHPILWGADQVLTISEDQPDEPRSVFAKNAVCARLYAHPVGRQRYQERMRELLADVWDEDTIMRDIQAIAALTSGTDHAVAAADERVRSQRAAIEAELLANSGRGIEPMTTDFVSTTCRAPLAARSAIDFTWDTSPTAYKLTLGLDMEVPTASGNISLVPLVSAQLAAQRADGAVQMGIAGNDTTSQRSVFVGLIMPIESYRAGVVEFHGFETFGVVAADASETEPKSILAFIGDGAITFDQIGMTVDAPVKGSWQGTAVTLGP